MTSQDTLGETLDLTIDQLMQQCPEMVRFLLSHHMNCIGCEFDHFHSLRAALDVYEIDPGAFLREFGRWLETSRPGSDRELLEDS